jgi:hypothetical protein
MVLLILSSFLQWRQTNCGKGLHIFCEQSVCSFIGHVSRCLHRQSVPKLRIKFRRRGITQKKQYNIPKKAEILKQKKKNTSQESPKEHVNSSQPDSVSNKTASCELEFGYEKYAN